jgi:hypothetical protein
MPIRIESRRDFENRGLDGVRRMAKAGNYAPDKNREAWEWIDEQEHGEERTYRRATLSIALVALFISGVSLIVSIAALFWKK